MVKDQKIRHVFDCSAAHYWNLFFFDERFQEGLFKAVKVKVDSLVLTGNGAGADRRFERTIIMQAERNLPAFLEKLIKGASQVRETNIYDPTAHTMRVEIELPVVGRRTVFNGVYTSKDLPGGQFERTFAGHCEVKIPLVGAKLERFFIEEMTGSVDKIWRYTQDWLATHPENDSDGPEAIAV